MVVNERTTLVGQQSFTEIPEHYQRILDLLDGHAKGQVSYEQIKAIDEEELRTARHLRNCQTNAWIDKHFPEVDSFDEF